MVARKLILVLVTALAVCPVLSGQKGAQVPTETAKTEAVVSQLQVQNLPMGDILNVALTKKEGPKAGSVPVQLTVTLNGPVNTGLTPENVPTGPQGVWDCTPYGAKRETDLEIVPEAQGNPCNDKNKKDKPLAVILFDSGNPIEFSFTPAGEIAVTQEGMAAGVARSSTPLKPTSGARWGFTNWFELRAGGGIGLTRGNTAPTLNGAIDFGHPIGMTRWFFDLGAGARYNFSNTVARFGSSSPTPTGETFGFNNDSITGGKFYAGLGHTCGRWKASFNPEWDLASIKQTTYEGFCGGSLGSLCEIFSSTSKRKNTTGGGGFHLNLEHRLFSLGRGNDIVAGAEYTGLYYRSYNLGWTNDFEGYMGFNFDP